jgi:hypothetical protein
MVIIIKIVILQFQELITNGKTINLKLNYFFRYIGGNTVKKYEMKPKNRKELLEKLDKDIIDYTCPSTTEKNCEEHVRFCKRYFFPSHLIHDIMDNSKKNKKKIGTNMLTVFRKKLAHFRIPYGIKGDIPFPTISICKAKDAFEQTLKIIKEKDDPETDVEEFEEELQLEMEPIDIEIDLDMIEKFKEEDVYERKVIFPSFEEYHNPKSFKQVQKHYPLFFANRIGMIEGEELESRLRSEYIGRKVPKAAKVPYEGIITERVNNMFVFHSLTSADLKYAVAIMGNRKTLVRVIVNDKPMNKRTMQFLIKWSNGNPQIKIENLILY